MYYRLLSLVLTISLFIIGWTPLTSASLSDTINPMPPGKWIEVEFTAYCPCALCCEGTADGKTAFMVDTKKVPYNLAGDRINFRRFQKVSIPLGNGVLDNLRPDERTFTVDDRGGALNFEARKYGIPRLDLRVKEHWWAVKFGRKRIMVFVYD